MAGGRRTGSGRKRTQSDARGWLKAVVDDPIRREAFRDCLDRALASEDPSVGVAAFFRAFEHAFGRPPQSLQLDHRTSEGPLEFRILDAAGAAFAFGGGDLPTRSIPLPTEASE